MSINRECIVLERFHSADDSARLDAWHATGAPLLDLRSPDTFAKQRLVGPVSNVPYFRLAVEGFMLPPREMPFALLVAGPVANPPLVPTFGNTAEEEEGAPPPSFQSIAAMTSEHGSGPPSVKAILHCFLSPRSPWIISDLFVDSPSLWDAAQDRGLVADRSEDIKPFHLWMPTPILRGMIDKIEEIVTVANDDQHRGANMPFSPSGGSSSTRDGPQDLTSRDVQHRGSSDEKRKICLDLGCGAGRDSVFLALRGWDVLAVDNMPKALARVRRLAARCGANASTELHCGNDGSFVFRDTCGEDTSDRGFEPESKPSTRAVGRVVTAMVDVRKNPEALMQCVSTFCGSSPLYKSDGVDLLVVARFLHRPLFEHMNPCASSSKVEVAMDTRAEKLPRCDSYDSKSDATGTSSGLVAPGGVVVYHHFLHGVQEHPIGHPSSPADILQKGELGAVFDGWMQLLNDEETPLPDGRPMTSFVAQRPIKHD